MNRVKVRYARDTRRQKEPMRIAHAHARLITPFDAGVSRAWRLTVASVLRQPAIHTVHILAGKRRRRGEYYYHK